MQVRTMLKADAIKKPIRTCARMGFDSGLYLDRDKFNVRHYWRKDHKFKYRRKTLCLGIFTAITLEKFRQEANAHIALAMSRKP
jgi:hypothetical protein